MAPVIAPLPAPITTPVTTPVPGQIAAPAPAETKPSFDIARVDRSGQAVVAGRAQPDATVTLLDNGKPVAKAQADSNGQFVIIPKAPLPSGGQESGRSMILPVITLGFGGAGVLARFTRSAMLEVLGQPYIRTALAKGVPWQRVVRGHALPNAAIPTVTIIGFMVGSLIAGAVVVESVFSWPGVGRLLVVSVSNRDLAVVQCILLLVASTMVISNLIVDLLYGVLDPRLRAGASGGH